jgi:hypothetical protein
MEKQIKIRKEFNSLESLLKFLEVESDHQCSIDYDSWDMRTDSNGQMAKCILIKKNGMHGMKLYLTQSNILKMTYIIPNKIMNAYFGKSKKARKDILEIVGGLVKNVLLSGAQKKAFEEMEKPFYKIAV